MGLAAATAYNGRMTRYPRILARRPVSTSRFLRAEEVDLEFRNGVRRTHECITGSGLGAVLIVPMLDAQTVLLVREYATGMDHYELGVPKGRLDRDETAEQGADRELKEEAGYGARDLRIIGTLALAPTYMTHRAHVVLARDLYPEKLEGDEPEPLDVVPWPLAGLHELLARDDVSDGRSLAALFMAREFLAGRYRP